MIIQNLDFKGVGTRPSKADAPLVVNPYAVRSLAIQRKSLQTIARNGSEIRQSRGRMDVV